jgi:pilus assembly protein CpaD
MITRDMLRMACVLAVMLAGSCTSDKAGKPEILQDGAANHPITVEPSYKSLKLAYVGTLSAEDAANLSAFVNDYLARGNGAISISAPAGPNANRALTALGEQLATMGVPRSRILVGTQDPTSSDGRVEIGYISYQAHDEPCGDWSIDVADTEDNKPMPNFGCAVQHDIAAQVADPRDLMQPRDIGPSDATRRMQVLNKYEQGQSTAAIKTKDQSGAVSDVATN